MKESELFLKKKDKILVKVSQLEAELDSRKKNFDNVQKDYQTKIQASKENVNRLRQMQEETTNRMISLFNLEKLQNLPPSVLSGGEKRRLSIAGVLAMEPQVILMDEPLANLDYPSIKMVLSTLLELKKKGITIVIVSHEAEKLLSLTDNTIILSEGRISGIGKSREMMKELRENEVYLPPKAEFEDLSWLI